MLKKRLIMILILILAGLVSSQAWAQDEFVVISKAPKKARVAVPAFKLDFQTEEGFGMGEELSGLLSTDLTRSGFFELIPRQAFLKPGPAVEDQEDWQAWLLLNAQAVIRGELTELGQGNYQLVLKLYDVGTQKMALGKSYKGSKQSLRRMVHRFADETVEWLTGKRGGFESRITFVSNKSGKKEIYAMDPDGFNLMQVTSTGKLNLSPVFLDSNQIYFTGYDRLNPDLYLMNIFSKEKKLISSQPGLNVSPAVGPSGKKLALAMESPGENLDIYIINPDGSHPLRVTSHPASDIQPTWSPDGHYLAFVSDRSGSPQVYMIDLYQGAESAGNKPIRLTQTGSYNVSPAWSPDGRYLSYCRRTGGQFDLFLIDFSGGDQRTETQITNTKYNEEDPAWSPDGRMLVYSANKNGNYDIFVISIFSKEPMQVTNFPSDETQPSWSPSLFEKGG
jgi:TolB protein